MLGQQLWLNMAAAVNSPSPVAPPSSHVVKALRATRPSYRTKEATCNKRSRLFATSRMIQSMVFILTNFSVAYHSTKCEARTQALRVRRETAEKWAKVPSVTGENLKNMALFVVLKFIASKDVKTAAWHKRRTEKVLQGRGLMLNHNQQFLRIQSRQFFYHGMLDSVCPKVRHYAHGNMCAALRYFNNGE